MRLFGEGFRVFLTAGHFSILTMTVWEWWLADKAAGGVVHALPFVMPPPMWRTHEMIFGYARAAIGGFLMTAAPGWTAGKVRPHWFIAFAAAPWCANPVVVCKIDSELTRFFPFTDA